MTTTEEQYLARDGTPITTDHCRCCGKTFPSGTLNLLGYYMASCDACLDHYYVMGAWGATPCKTEEARP